MANLPKTRAQLERAKKKTKIERWLLYRTLTVTATYTIPYSDGNTMPYANAYRQLYSQLTDEMLCMTSYVAKSLKLRSQEKTTEPAPGKFMITLKLYIYTTER